MKKTNVKKLTQLAITTAIAMVLSFVESQIPPLTSIPGIKIGLANIAVIFALYCLGTKEALTVSFVRIFAISILFGQFMSFLYSLVGGLLSFAVMFLLKRFTPLSKIGVSVAGGVCHNIGQIITACVLLQTDVVMYYLPFLLISGTVSGIAIGVASALLIKKLEKNIV